MACLYCGKEIGPFRLLRDAEFCTAAHRRDYRARLGKAIGRLSTSEPPPAPVADFIPNKPNPGNKQAPVVEWALQTADAELRFPPFAVSIVPMANECALPPSWPKAIPALEAIACDSTLAPHQDYAVTAKMPGLALALEDRLPELSDLVEQDPPQAGTIRTDRPAESELYLRIADITPGIPALNLSTLRNAALARPLALCGIAAGFAPQVVEAFLPPSRLPEHLEASIATLPPAFSLTAAEWTVAGDLAEAVASPAAQAVEAFLPPLPEPVQMAFSGSLAEPVFQLAAAEWIVDAAVAEFVASPAAQAVENFLPLPAAPIPVAFAAPGIVLPTLPLTTDEWMFTGEMAELISADLADFVAGPAAAAVETFLPMPLAPQEATFPVSLALPRLEILAADWISATPIADAAQSPSAEAVESFLPMAPEPLPISLPVAAAILPSPALVAADWTIEVSLADAVAGPAPQPVEVFLPMGIAPAALAFETRTLRLPEFTLTAEAELIEEFVPPVVVSDASEDWMATPPAVEVACEVIPALSAPLPSMAAVQAPGVAALAMEQPMVRWSGGWRQSAQAEPVLSYVRPRVHGAVATQSALQLPTLHSIRRSGATTPDAAVNPAATTPPASAVPAASRVTEVQGTGWRPTVQLPAFELQQTAAQTSAQFRAADPAVAQPPVADFEGPAPEVPAAVAVHVPFSAVVPGFRLPEPGAAGMEFFCQRTNMTPVCRLEWQSRPATVFAPRFVVKPIPERLEEAPAPVKQASKTPAFAEVFSIADIAQRKVYKSSFGSMGKAVAAALLLGVGLWFGAGAAKIARRMAAINTSFPNMTTPGAVEGEGSAAGPSASVTPPKAPTGAIAKVRHAIQERAAVELTDTFRQMESWGAAAKAIPSGWSRNPDGYVRTGQLAVYQPTKSFSDYRLEFFGQIEKKSMSWVVRAKDTQNYYAMKFVVVEPGLRPVIAVAHYPVLDGKKGKRVQVPLDVMVHNDEPFHVAVDVHGNHVTTSIEGQPVDSWTDDTLKTGGVGFFSDVGESARLYWIRVTRNQDWLGRVCAYLSGGSTTDTAQLWRGDFPTAPSQPSLPALPPNTEVALAAFENDEYMHMAPQRGRILKYGRTELCRS